MKLLPIVPGCMAVVINSVAGNNGICVTVLDYIGVHEFVNGQNVWQVDKSLKGVGFFGDPRPSTPFIDERLLMRIDGGEFVEDKETVEVKL